MAWMDEQMGREPHVDEPAVLGKPAPLEPMAEVVAGAPRVEAAEVDSTSGAAWLRARVVSGEELSDDENVAALRIGLAVPLRHGAPAVGQECPSCGRRFAVGEAVHLVDGSDGEDGRLVLVHAKDGAPAVAVADRPGEHEVLDPVRAALGVEAHRDPGDETDHDRPQTGSRVTGPRPRGELERDPRKVDEALERFHASVDRLPEVTSEQNPDAEAARPVDELGNAYDARYDDFRRHDPFGGKVRVPIVEPAAGPPLHDLTSGKLPPLGAGHDGFAENIGKLEGKLLDDDDVMRIGRAVCQPGDLTGELEAFVSIGDVRDLVATVMAERSRSFLEGHGPVFEACMELALVAGLAELERTGKSVIRADANGVICMVVAKAPLAGELAAWADTKTSR